MEIVKDELGIYPEDAAADLKFKLDLELLPFLKQKQLVNYLRILVAFQRKKQDEGCRVRLVSSLIETSPQPQTSQQQSKQHEALAESAPGQIYSVFTFEIIYLSL